jgi:hypothetical protein
LLSRTKVDLIAGFVLLMTNQNLSATDLVGQLSNWQKDKNNKRQK